MVNSHLQAEKNEKKIHHKSDEWKAENRKNDEVIEK